MRILLTNLYSPFSNKAGGGQITVHNLAQNMVELGHEVYTIYTYECEEVLKRANDSLNYPVIWIKHYSFRPFLLIQVALKAKSLVKSRNIEIIQSFDAEGFLIPYLVKNCKFIATSHFPLIPRLTSLGIKRFLKSVLSYRKLLLQKQMCKKADHVIAISRFSAQNIRDSFGIDRNKISVCYSGVSKPFLEANYNYKSGPVNKITFFGRIDVYQKGIDIVLKAISEILKEREVQPAIIGEGSGIIQLKKLATELGIDSKVKFLGWLNHRDLAKHLAQETTICTLPSRCESFGLSIAEAMAVGVPVVTTKVGAIPEIVEGGESGILVSPDNPQELATEIIKLLDNPISRTKLGKSGSKRIRNNFTWRDAAVNYCKVYEQLINNDKQ